MDAAVIYDETRQRLTELVQGAEGHVDRQVPACPDWTVKDVIAHLTGLAADWRNGNLADYASPSWTATQVRDRRDRALDALLDEWAMHSAAIAPSLKDPTAGGVPDFMPLIVITDLAAHEHDVRGALGSPGARDSAAVQVGLRSQIGGLRQHFAGLGADPLRVVATGLREWMVGHGEPVASVEAEPFELFRATGGRRTMDEVRALRWTGGSEQFIEHFLQPPFAWPERPLGE